MNCPTVHLIIFLMIFLTLLFWPELISIKYSPTVQGNFH
jgi:hypothetical protein